MFEPSLVYQHLAAGRGGTVNVQLWQVINLVGGPLAAILLLPAVLDDVEKWWRARAEADQERPRPS